MKKKTIQAPPPKAKPDSVQVIASFADVSTVGGHGLFRLYLDSLYSGNDLIAFIVGGGGHGKSEFEVKLEKVQGDSSWFVKRTIRYMKNYFDYSAETDIYNSMWKKKRVDSIADTTKFLSIMETMVNFAPEMTMVEDYVIVDSNTPSLYFKKDNRCMEGHTYYFYDSPRLVAIYDELLLWTRNDLVQIKFMTDSNFIESHSKIDEVVECRVVDVVTSSKGSLEPFVIAKGDQKNTI